MLLLCIAIYILANWHTERLLFASQHKQPCLMSLIFMRLLVTICSIHPGRTRVPANTVAASKGQASHLPGASRHWRRWAQVMELWRVCRQTLPGHTSNQDVYSSHDVPWLWSAQSWRLHSQGKIACILSPSAMSESCSWKRLKSRFWHSALGSKQPDNS